MNDPAISVVIPAAGGSRRLGQNKQLISFKGKPLLQLAIEHAGTIKPKEIIVVTGAASNEIRANIVSDGTALTPVSIIHNKGWAEGIGSSIAAGISAVCRDSDGVLIVLADQWRIQPADLKKLMQTWSKDSSRIVASRVGDYLGPPVIFPRDFFATLALLSGDQGAKKVVQANLERLIEVLISNAALDLDTPEDLAVLLSSQVPQLP